MKTLIAVLLTAGSLALLGCEGKPAPAKPDPAAKPAAAAPTATATAQTAPASTGGW